MTWRWKPNKSSPPQIAFGRGVYHSHRKQTRTKLPRNTIFGTRHKRVEEYIKPTFWIRASGQKEERVYKGLEVSPIQRTIMKPLWSEAGHAVGSRQSSNGDKVV